MIFLPEPLLGFGYGQKMVYPRDGLFLFGPTGDPSDVPAVRYGVVGTPEAFAAWHPGLLRSAALSPFRRPAHEVGKSSPSMYHFQVSAKRSTASGPRNLYAL